MLWTPRVRAVPLAGRCSPWAHRQNTSSSSAGRSHCEAATCTSLGQSGGTRRGSWRQRSGCSTCPRCIPVGVEGVPDGGRTGLRRYWRGKRQLFTSLTRYGGETIETHGTANNAITIATANRLNPVKRNNAVFGTTIRIMCRSVTRQTAKKHR